jgi:high-affinity Fe2+/Pb2+ permease
MQNFINSVAIFDIVLFATFFIGINVIFYKLIKEVLNSNKEKFLGVFSILALDVLAVAILYTNFSNI